MRHKHEARTSGPTVLQRKILAYMAKGPLLSVRQLGRDFSWTSTNNAMEHMERLQKKGFVRVVEYQLPTRVLRRFELTPEGLAAAGVETPDLLRQRARTMLPRARQLASILIPLPHNREELLGILDVLEKAL